MRQLPARDWTLRRLGGTQGWCLRLWVPRCLLRPSGSSCPALLHPCFPLAAAPSWRGKVLSEMGNAARVAILHIEKCRLRVGLGFLLPPETLPEHYLWGSLESFWEDGCTSARLKIQNHESHCALASSYHKKMSG